MKAGLGNPRYALAGLVLAAALFRLLFFLEMADTPLPRLAEWRETDMAFFQEWAGVVADGDYLTDRPLHPYHGWHGMLAERFLTFGGNAQSTEQEMRGLWDVWYGGKRFHQEPAYAYVFGAVRSLGGDASWMFVLQGLMGIGTIVLLFAFTRRLFGYAAALVAAGLTLLFGPLLFYELLLLRVSLVLFTGMLALYLTDRALEQEEPLPFLLAGVALGGAFLVKSTALLFFLGIVVLVVARRGASKAALRRAGLMAAGMLLPILPAVVRNVVVGVPAFQFSSVAAVTFINANAPDFVPGTGFYVSKYVLPVMVKSHHSLVFAAMDTVSLHDGVFSYPVMLLKKFLLFFSPTEIPNNANYHYFSRFSTVLSWGQLSFWWIGVPAVGGIVLAVRRWRRSLPLLVYVLCGMVPMVLFYNLSRFRTPLVPFLAPFAAYALVAAVREVRERRFHALIITVIAGIVVGGAALTVVPSGSPLIREADYVVGNNQWENLARGAYEAGDKQGALVTLERALQAEPAELTSLSSGDTRRLRTLARSFGKLHFQCAALAGELGDETTSARHLDRARALHELLGSGVNSYNTESR